jgi:hypothetical protein
VTSSYVPLLALHRFLYGPLGWVHLLTPEILRRVTGLINYFIDSSDILICMEVIVLYQNDVTQSP